jgi:hypothetical protein
LRESTNHDEIAKKYEVSNTTIAIAWLLRRPAHMQPVTGTMNIVRLKDCCKASDVFFRYHSYKFRDENLFSFKNKMYIGPGHGLNFVSFNRPADLSILVDNPKSPFGKDLNQEMIYLLLHHTPKHAGWLLWNEIKETAISHYCGFVFNEKTILLLC